MIEIKNYDGTVPTKQVDKFYSDICLSECDSAMMISSSPIANKKNISYELIDKKPVFIVVMNENVPFTVIVYILLLIESVVPTLNKTVITSVQRDRIVEHIDSICSTS